MNLMRKNDGPRVVVVTGASAGVGRAVARAFADEGDDVALLARGHEGLAGASRDVRARGRQALAINVDMADNDAVEAAAQRVEAELGPIDVWVNNAMVSVFSPFVDMTPDEFKRVTEVTYLGYVHGTRAALKRMRARDQGRIIQVGSALAYRGIPLQSAYCGAKHAIQGFTEAVRTELMHEKSHVRISMVQLPAMNTPQFMWTRSHMPHPSQPVPPIYQPEVAARVVVWLSRHYRREVYVGGSTAVSVIGNKMAPGLGDRYLGLTGFESQMLPGDHDPKQVDNLFQPLEGDFGSHGAFDARAKGHSAYTWFTLHRRTIGLLGLGVGAAAFAARRAWENRPLA